MPSTLITYINNNSGTVNLFFSFLGSASIGVCNIRTANSNVRANHRSTPLTTNHVNMLRNGHACLVTSSSKRVRRARSVSTNLSCPNINPRRDFLGSVGHIRCINYASGRSLRNFRRIAHGRNVVPTLRSTRTITCTLGLTGAVAPSRAVVIGVSNHNSGSRFVNRSFYQRRLSFSVRCPWLLASHYVVDNWCHLAFLLTMLNRVNVQEIFNAFNNNGLGGFYTRR